MRTKAAGFMDRGRNYTAYISIATWFTTGSAETTAAVTVTRFTYDIYCNCYELFYLASINRPSLQPHSQSLTMFAQSLPPFSRPDIRPFSIPLDRSGFVN